MKERTRTGLDSLQFSKNSLGVMSRSRREWAFQTQECSKSKAWREVSIGAVETNHTLKRKDYRCAKATVQTQDRQASCAAPPKAWPKEKGRKPITQSFSRCFLCLWRTQGKGAGLQLYKNALAGSSCLIKQATWKEKETRERREKQGRGRGVDEGGGDGGREQERHSGTSPW